MADETTQFWLVELDQYGNPTLIDGSHSEREGAEEALTLVNRLGLARDVRYAIAEIRLSEPTGKHRPLNEVAIDFLNSVGIEPD